MFIPMTRRMTRAVPLLLALALATCTDGVPPTDLSMASPGTRLAVNPVFDPALAVEGSADINRIRIRAYLMGTDSILGQVIQDVTSGASQWTLDFRIQAPTGTNAQVLLTVELINVLSGVETVEWSGQIGPLIVLPGSAPEIQNVGVVRGPLDNLSVTAVSIQEPIEDLLEENSVQLSATAVSSDPTLEPQLFWASLDPGVASVSESGLLTGLAPGSARVVATAGAVADTAQATILARPGDVEITPGSALIQALGDEVTFSAAVLDGRGTAMPGEAVLWGVESPEILEDLGNGRYRALARGNTVVTVSSASAPEVTASAQVMVQQAVGSVEVLPESQLLTARGDTLRFTAQAFDGNGNPILGMPFYWATNNTRVATIDSGGLLTAMNTGVVTVSARAGADPMVSAPEGVAIPGLVGETTLEVNRVVDRVEIRPATHTFTSIGEGVVLTALALDANGYTIDGQDFTWSTSHAEVATVNGAGLAAAVADGEAVITASTGGKEGSSAVTVNQLARSLHWVTQPPDGLPEVALDPPPSVEILDEVGSRVTSFSGTVQLQAVLQPSVGPPVGTILGTSAVVAASGVAVFPDAAIQSSGTYILVARSGSLVPAPSDEFTIGSSDAVDLKVEKGVDSPSVAEGTDVIFTISLENLGPNDATNIQVGDLLPAGLDFVSASMTPAAGYDSGTGIWSLEYLEYGESAALFLTATAGSGTVGTTITNTASVLAVDQFDTDDTNDAASASVTVTESPVDWTGSALGNTELIVGSYPPPTTPHVLAGGGNLLGPTPTLLITSVGTYSTTAGGSVTIQVDGDFSYTPPVGFSGVDDFQFFTEDDVATAFITVSDMVWYVDNTNPTAGTGTSDDPFQTLAQAEAATAAPADPDRIYLLHGDGTPYLGGIALRDTQILDGEGFGLTIPAWSGLINTGPGSAPIITNGAGVGVLMTAGSVLRGVDIVNTSSQAIYSTGTGGGTVEDVNITGSAIGIYSYFTSGTFDFTNVNITDVSDRAIWIFDGDPTFNFQGAVNLTAAHNQLFNVSGTTGGSVTLSGGPFVDSGSSLQSVSVSTVQGAVSVTGPLTITNPSGGGVSLSTNTGDVTFSQLSINSNGSAGITASNNTGMTTITSGDVTTVGNLGLNFNNSPLTASFTEVFVNNTTGVGGGVYLWGTQPGTTSFTRLKVNTTAPSGGAQFVDAGTVNVTDAPNSYITAFGVPAISVVNTAMNMSFATFTSQDPTAGGVANGAYFLNASGSFTSTAGNLFNPQTTDGTSLRINGGDANFTIGGEIRNLQPDAWALRVENRTGGTVTLNAYVNDSGRGVVIGGPSGSNDGGTVVFAGGMNLIGPGYLGDPPFYAYGPVSNGTLEVTGTNNVLAAPVGYPALEITNTAIGAGGVTFRQVQADGDYTVSNGIILDNTGTGPFSITGDGTTPGSGGYVDNMSANGFNLANTGPVTLEYLGISGNTEAGIIGTDVAGLNLTQTTIFAPATGHGIFVQELAGNSTLSEATLSSANGPIPLNVENSGTTGFAMDILNSSFTVGNPAGNPAAFFGMTGDASGVVNVKGSTFTNSGRGINATAYDNSTMELNISDGSVISGNLYGLLLYQNLTGRFKLDVQDSQLLANTTQGIYAVSLVGSDPAGEFKGQVLNSEIRNSPNGAGFIFQGNSQGYIRFRSNVIDPENGVGLMVQAGTPTGGGGSSVGAEAIDNFFSVDLTGPAIDFKTYGGTTLCAAIQTNNITISDANHLRVEQGSSTSLFNLEGLNGGTGFVTDAAVVRTYLDGINTLVGGGSSDVLLSTGMGGVGAGTCVPPIL